MEVVESLRVTNRLIGHFITCRENDCVDCEYAVQHIKEINKSLNYIPGGIVEKYK